LESEDISGLHKTNDIERRSSECEKQIRQWVEQRQKYYEQFVLGEIDRDTHTELKNECTLQLERLNNQLAILKQTELDKQANKKAVVLAKESLSDTATPQDIVNALVDKILVFPENRIEIRWNFVNFAVKI